jgi:PhzF family phenazine biosynthesis protein
MKPRAFNQVDVFASGPYSGNPLAVVLDGVGLSDAEMQRFANWTNLSETTFLLPPTDPAADYRVRIFTAQVELPFAGHPTLGSCHAWLQAGGASKREDGVIAQECGVGLVSIRRDGERLAFAAPKPRRDGPVDEAFLAQIARGLRIERDEIVASQWVDNGPGWVGVMLASAERVLALKPDFAALHHQTLGVVGAHPLGADAQFELRAFFSSSDDPAVEDPVTGSLNASVGQWLIGAGIAPERYVAAQGTALGRAGRIYVERDAAGQVWVGGKSLTGIEGVAMI